MGDPFDWNVREMTETLFLVDFKTGTVSLITFILIDDVHDLSPFVYFVYFVVQKLFVFTPDG